MDSTWSGNTFDDYQGYDLDGDGVGDIHYEVRKFTSEVTSKHPDLHFFHGSLSLAMIDLAGHVVPLFQPILLMQDENPRVQPSASSLNAMEWIHARAAQ